MGGDFGTANALLEVVQAQHRGRIVGIPSICSANEFVLQAALEFAKDRQGTLLIEATCNQVNQDGGYTSLTPATFRKKIHSLAKSKQFPIQRIILGGDHLGPYPWRNQPSDLAMDKATELVACYVSAGYRKIHLDTSMPCGDEDQLTTSQIAERTAELAEVSEGLISDAHDERILPHYVIGSDVPAPGGSEGSDRAVWITTPEDVMDLIQATMAEFYRRGLERAWKRVIAVVVQPGVEFSQDRVHPYVARKTRRLSRLIEGYPRLIYEAHSTDYQTRKALRRLVEGHFAILKVGPALTFAFREAIFALAEIEKEVAPASMHSQLEAVVENAMLADPQHWDQHYTGAPHEVRMARKFGYSDRIRYYWRVPDVSKAIDKLLANLSRSPIPSTLLSMHLPEQYEQVKRGAIAAAPRSLISSKISSVLADYAVACGWP